MRYSAASVASHMGAAQLNGTRTDSRNQGELRLKSWGDSRAKRRMRTDGWWMDRQPLGAHTLASVLFPLPFAGHEKDDPSPRQFNQCTTYTPTFTSLVMPLPRIDADDRSPGGCVATYTVLFWTGMIAQRSTSIRLPSVSALDCPQHLHHIPFLSHTA